MLEYGVWSIIRQGKYEVIFPSIRRPDALYARYLLQVITDANHLTESSSISLPILSTLSVRAVSNCCGQTELRPDCAWLGRVGTYIRTEYL
jgi:hypothetical protein